MKTTNNEFYLQYINLNLLLGCLTVFQNPFFEHRVRTEKQVSGRNYRDFYEPLKGYESGLRENWVNNEFQSETFAHQFQIKILVLNLQTPRFTQTNPQLSFILQAPICTPYQFQLNRLCIFLIRSLQSYKKKKNRIRMGSVPSKTNQKSYFSDNILANIYREPRNRQLCSIRLKSHPD